MSSAADFTKLLEQDLKGHLESLNRGSDREADISVSAKGVEVESGNGSPGFNKTAIGAVPLKMEHDDIPDYLLERLESGERLAERLSFREYQVICVNRVLALAAQCGLGLCSRNGQAYMFNGEYWRVMDCGELETFLGVAAERIGVDSGLAQHFSFRGDLVKQFFTVSGWRGRVSDDKVMINLSNGTFEVDGERLSFRDHDRKDFLTYRLPFAYDEGAACPIFENYLNRVLPNKNLQMIMAEYLGYLFVKSSRLKLEKALILYGEGANGKSVMFEIVNALLGGNENVSNYSLENLSDSRGYHRAMIGDKLVNYASEINGNLDAAIFKQLVSGEPVVARLPYGKPFTITGYAKLIFNCNELPRRVEHTKAFFRRFLIIPFNVSIPKEEQDKELACKIIDNELPGVLNWVMEGLRRLLSQKNFTDSNIVDRVLSDYARMSDSVAVFLEEKGYGKSDREFIATAELYGLYQIFCDDYGYRPVSGRTFNVRLRNLGVDIVRRNYGMAARLGRAIFYG